MAIDQNSNNQNPINPPAKAIPEEDDIASPGLGFVPSSAASTSMPLNLSSQPATANPVQTGNQAVTQTTQVATSGGKRFPKKLLFAVFGILLLVVGVLAFVKLVLPNLSGGGNKDVELVWWGLWEDDGIIQPLIDEYESQHPGVTIKYVANSKEDYRERLASALASENGPDIFRFHNSWVPMFTRELDRIPTEIMSAQEFQDTFYPVASDDLISKEGPVGIPLMYDGLAMFINEDIFTTYGKTIPRDWNELRETARALTIKDERGVITQSGAALGTTSNVDHWPEIVALLMLQNGANPDKPKDSAGRGGQALVFYKQFAETDKVWDDTLPPSTVAFATGRVGIYFGPSWRAFEILDRNPSLKFRVESVPQVPKEDPTAPDITYASYWAEGVSNKSKHSEEAWKFLKYLSEPGQLTRIYQNESQSRRFGEPYPRPDMRDLLLTDPNVGGFLELAHNAKSSHLYSRTFDGASGINTSLAGYYADAIGAVDVRSEPKNQIDTLASGVLQVLSRYGLASTPAPKKK